MPKQNIFGLQIDVLATLTHFWIAVGWVLLTSILWSGWPPAVIFSALFISAYGIWRENTRDFKQGVPQDVRDFFENKCEPWMVWLVQNVLVYPCLARYAAPYMNASKWAEAMAWPIGAGVMFGILVL